MTLEEAPSSRAGSPATRRSPMPWAYAMAVEGATGTEPPPGHWRCGILLELERIANHLGDLGYLATTSRSRSAFSSSGG